MSENNFPPNGDSDHTPNAANDDPLSDDAIAEAIAKSADNEAESESDKDEELSKLKDQVLRLAAELENTRRRADREKVDVSRYAIANFARDLLGVADNFERALQAIGDEPAPEVGPETVSGLVAGLRMTEKELLNVLERHGVKRISPKGEKFDPNLHQAVAQIPGGDVPSGHVVDVAQPGFTIKDRVLRAAMVTVSNGQPTAPSESGGDDAAPEPGAHVDTEA